MNINIGPRGTLEIDNARIIFRNLEGRGGLYNREGDRNFALVVPDEDARDALIEQGYNVKTKAPRDEDEEPLMYLTIKVKPNGRGPRIYLVSGRSKRELPEESWGLIDQISIANVSLDIHAYDWTVNGKVGRSAYLAAMEVTQNIDRFAATMEEEV